MKRSHLLLALALAVSLGCNRQEASAPPPPPQVPSTGAAQTSRSAEETIKAAHAGASTATKLAQDGPVPKAEGPDARTVAELHAAKAELRDKPVAVRGKVVKLNTGIMGKNWVHLQDGSGSPDAGNFDITATIGDTVAVGDVIAVRGILHLDRDFGAGYRYPLIIEDAQVVR